MLLVEEEIHTTFDSLVARRIISHGPITHSRLEDQSFAFEFFVCPALATKPTISTSNALTCQGDLPTFGPGSDLLNLDPDLIVRQIGQTHFLVLNRFCVFRPQYLILTSDSYKRQTELLDRHDLWAAWSSLREFQSKNFVIFNCGREAGCSRSHKHMQIIPYAETFTLFPDRESIEDQAVPFKYYLRGIEDLLERSEDTIQTILSESYNSLCDEAYRAWQASVTTDLDYFPHNMVLTKNWMMIIPRRQAGVRGANANAAGMMGLVWVASSQELTCWKSQGPRTVLAALGIGC